MPKKRCKYCREYGDRDSMVTRGLSSFCNEEHFLEFQREYAKSQQTKAKARSIKRERRKEPEGISEELRERIFEHDGYKCRLCGVGGFGLVIHHVIYRSEKANKQWQDEPSNLITLHNFPCHLDVIHKNKDLYQPLCLQIIWLREVCGDRKTSISDLLEGN